MISNRAWRFGGGRVAQSLSPGLSREGRDEDMAADVSVDAGPARPSHRDGLWGRAPFCRASYGHWAEGELSRASCVRPFSSVRQRRGRTFLTSDEQDARLKSSRQPHDAGGQGYKHDSVQRVSIIWSFPVSNHHCVERSRRRNTLRNSPFIALCPPFTWSDTVGG